MANVTEPEEGSDSTGRPERELNPQMTFEVSNSHNALPGVGDDGLHCSHLQSITRTPFGGENFGAGIDAFCGKMADEPDAVPSKLIAKYFCRKISRPSGGKSAWFMWR